MFHCTSGLCVLAACIGSDMFHCTSGLCVPRKLLCDGTDHCGDGSDEQEECGELPYHLFQLSSNL